MNPDDLRAAMRAHDDEAPRADDFAPRPVHRRAALPIAAAIVVTAAVVTVVAVVWNRPNVGSPAALRTTTPSTRHLGTSVSPPVPPGLACPNSIPDTRDSANGWVPAGPQTSSASAGLVPDRTPSAVVVCSYAGRYPTTGPDADVLKRSSLAGERVLSGDLGAVSRDLARTPRGQIGLCTANLLITDHQYYEIGLSYQGKVVWVAAPGNHCKGTTNGAFDGKTNLRLPAAQAYRWGRWDTDAGLHSYCHGVPDSRSSLPTNPTRLTVCIRSTTGTVVLRAGSAAASTAANGYADEAGREVAECAAASRDPWEFAATFSYADGSKAVIRGDAGCVFGPGGPFAGKTAEGLIFTLTEVPFDTRS